MLLVHLAVMSKPTTETNQATPTVKNDGSRRRRNEPNPLGGNFILMPSLLEYLSPDLTLPEQYFEKQRNDDGMGAEKSLMYAVLKDGIRCFYKHVGATRRKYRKMSAEAEEWILEDTWDYPFSFRVICDTLGIDSDCLRARLVDWKDSELERRRVTGDTKSVQVGRSPFPSPLDDYDESYKAAVVDDIDGDVDLSDSQDASDTGEADFEHVSLDDADYGKYGQVA